MISFGVAREQRLDAISNNQRGDIWDGRQFAVSAVKYDKLVRDKIPEIIKNAGKEPVTDCIEKEQMGSALDRKLQEETREYLESHSIEEMADVLEVLHGIAHHMGIAWDEVEAVRAEKKRKRGGFEKGIRLLEVRDL